MRLALLCALTLLASQAFAATGIFQTYVVLDRGNGSQFLAGELNADNAPKFTSFTFGPVAPTGTLILRGGEVKTWKNGSSDVFGADLFYRVYRDGTAPGDFQSLDLPFAENLPNSGDQKWQRVDANVDLVARCGAVGVSCRVDLYWRSRTNEGDRTDGGPGDPRSNTFGTTPAASSVVFNPSSAPGDGAGWRHLSSPVEGVTVNDLAGLNLVQGVPAGGAFPQQYPASPSNVYTGYNNGPGPNGFVVAPSTAFELEPGRGFFWYLYDNDFDPVANGNPTGTSVSRELTGFVLTATGQTPVVNVNRTFTDYIGLGPGSRYYLIGNPFARPLAASGVTTSPGAIQGNVLQIWDPAQGQGGGYILIDRTDANDYLAVWQGAFVEVATAGNQTVTYDYAATSTTASPPFYGRSASTGSIRFRLDGVIGGGTTVVDQAAIIRFHPDGLPGWDPLDASKLLPFGTTYALVAPVLERDGAPYHASVNTLPPTSATVPVAFQTTHPGEFTLSWTGTLMDGFVGSLRDLQTGTVVDLSVGAYAFVADESLWTNRFEVVVASLVAGQEAPRHDLSLAPVRPNPAAGTARATLATGPATLARVVVVDALGRVVATVLDGAVAPNASLDLAVDTRALAPGAYVLRAESHGQVLTRPLTVVR